MYFNDKKSNTNIDNDFNNKQNILSSFLSLMSKYKKIIIISIAILILLIIMIMIFSNRKVNKYLELTGDEIITIYEGTDYVEPGYKAYNSKDEDLKSEVTIETNLNNKAIGKYEILYTLGNITRIRIVNVIAKPKEYTYIHLNGVEKGTTDVYVKLGEEYIEPGYTVFSSTGTDLTNNVVVTGEVDTSKKGTYIKTYTVMDTSGITISETRNVIVIDSDINLSLSSNSYTNKDIIINIEVIDEYFDYMILPDNTKVNTNKYSYKVNNNGKYTFKTSNKKGMIKESSIEVKNIDKIAPSGSCSGYFQLGTSKVTINATDNIKIKKYEINGISYTTKNISINNQIETINLTIYDESGNTKNISCNLEDKNSLITSDKSITFSYKYVENSPLPYGLFTPSNVKYNKKTPLIISLHGASERGNSQQTFKNKFLVKMFNEWELEGFNAYILFPHLSGNGYSTGWSNESSAKKLFDLIDTLINDLNIDTDKIIIEGHSLGGSGTLYIGAHSRARFSAVVPISGYPSYANLNNIKVPIRGYVGSSNKGEDTNSINYMREIFKNNFGIEKLFERKVSHDNIPITAFTEDLNNDNKSDLIEWMLTQ